MTRRCPAPPRHACAVPGTSTSRVRDREPGARQRCDDALTHLGIRLVVPDGDVAGERRRGRREAVDAAERGADRLDAVHAVDAGDVQRLGAIGHRPQATGRAPTGRQASTTSAVYSVTPPSAKLPRSSTAATPSGEDSAASRSAWLGYRSRAIRWAPGPFCAATGPRVISNPIRFGIAFASGTCTSS